MDVEEEHQEGDDEEKVEVSTLELNQKLKILIGGDYY